MTTNSQPNHDLVCFSHLRWDFVFQRPQHLMSRFSRQHRVFFVEEPLIERDVTPRIDHRMCPSTGVHVVVPVTPGVLPRLVSQMMDRFFREQNVSEPIAWFYSPMWLEGFPPSLRPAATIYDCMDELSGFKGASERLAANEMRLFDLADLVFTGGISLFEAKRALHPGVHAFPSGVDADHFAQARTPGEDPADQRSIPHPRLGFAGVIDERMDLDLLAQVADLRPDWQFVMIGPTVKIDPETLPRRSNIHWLGGKQYRQLPSYFAHWEVAIMPFALNDATRFISPTKTPEFLAAGLPVVSTPIRDVVRPYGDLGLARIAETPESFVMAAEEAMSHSMGIRWRERTDDFLRGLSWDSVWMSMNSLITGVLDKSQRPPELRNRPQEGESAYV